MEGVPWTKGWGLFFLVSFILIEISVISSRALHLEPSSESGSVGRLGDMKSKFHACHGVLLLAELFLHTLLLSWFALDIQCGFSPPAVKYSNPPESFAQVIVHSLYLAVEVMAVLLAGWSVLLIVFPFSGLFKDESRHWFMALVIRHSAFLAVIFASLIVSAFEALLKGLVVDMGSHIGVASPNILTYTSMPWLGERWPQLTGIVFVAWPIVVEQGRLTRTLPW